MKKTLYAIKHLGFWKSTAYLILYPLRFLPKASKKLNDIHDEIRWHEKICKYFKNAGLEREYMGSWRIQNESKKYFKKYGLKINTDWQFFYARVNGFESKYYIPEDLYYRQIEPYLIYDRLLGFYSDKNLYDQIFEGVNQPETYLRYFNGTFYCPKYHQLTLSEALDRLNKIKWPWIIKPSVESGNGRDIHEGNSQNETLIIDGVETSLSELSNFYRTGFIIQEKIASQNRTLAQFHPGSLNTFRVITLRLNNKLYSISTRIKFGTNNRIVDNEKGVWCGVDNNGLIHSNGINGTFQRFDAHPDTDIKFRGTKISEFKNVLDFAKRLHERIVSADLVSWDIGYSAQNEPIFIECNVRFQGITTSQVVNGPLFGDLTDDVLAEVVKRKNKFRE